MHAHHVALNRPNKIVIHRVVEVVFRTPHGVPIPGVLCRAHLPDGTVFEGRTDNNGEFWVPHAASLTQPLEVEFPELDESVWKRAGNAT